MDELLVAGKPLQGQGLVRGPLGPVGVGAERCLDAPADPIAEEGRSLGAAVDDDLGTLGDALVLEQLLQLSLVEPREPGGGQRDGARNVATSRSAGLAPAVVMEQRSDVHDAKTRLPDPAPQLARGDVRLRQCGLDCSCAHMVLLR